MVPIVSLISVSIKGMVFSGGDSGMDSASDANGEFKRAYQWITNLFQG